MNPTPPFLSRLISVFSLMVLAICVGACSASTDNGGLSLSDPEGCSPYTSFCIQNALALCSPDGTAHTLTAICTESETCTKHGCVPEGSVIPTGTEGGEGGDPEGGNPEGGNPEGGNPEGGNPEGGDPEGGDPEGGDPDIPVNDNCIDGQYAENPPNTDGDISPEIAEYSAGNALAFIQAVLQKRYPLGLSILNGGLASNSFSNQDCVATFLSNTSSAQAVIGQLSTLVHECGHFYDMEMGGFSKSSYFINEAITFSCQGGAGPTNGGQTFARSLIKNDEYAALHTPCDSWTDSNCEDTYAGLYLNGDPNDNNFDSGDQGFDMLLEETVQYVNSLATSYAFQDNSGFQVSARDGILTFLWYLERYLRMARLEYPEAYTLLSGNTCWREAILTVWGRAWLYLSWTTNIPSLGIDDAKLMGLVMDPDLLTEIDLLRGQQGCL